MSSRRDGSASKLPATSFMSARFQPGRLCDWIPNRPLRADRCTVSVTPPDPGANTARSARPSPSKSPPIVFVEPSGYVVVMSCGTIGLVSPNPGPAVESQRHPASSTATTVRKFLFSPEVTGTTGTVAVPSTAAGAQIVGTVSTDPTP